MNSLRELQRQTYRAIVHEAPFVLPKARGRPDLVSAGLGVYRNNACETFRRTLASTFPAIARLVGDDCFRGLARIFARDFPSRHGDLGRYGAEFPQLLDVLYSDSAFDYLADTARLEWAVAAAEAAADEEPMDTSRLACVDAGDYAELRFRLVSGTGVLASRFPVFSIWRAQLAENVAEVSLGRGAEHLLISRRHGVVTVERLERDQFVFVRALADGDSLGDAIAAAIAANSDFDPSAALHPIAARGLLADFSLNDSERY